MRFPAPYDKNFYEFIDDNYSEYKISKHKKSLEKICFPKKYEFQIPQKFLAEFINPETPYKGVLVYHRIGAGKTCAAINVAENFVGDRNIYVVLPASLKGNFRSELRSLCAGERYLTNQEREVLKDLHPSDVQYKNIIRESDKKIDMYYTILSYNKFVDMLNNKQLNLKDSLLIIDEIHNMVSEKGTYYDVLYKAVNGKVGDLRTIIMTATPIFDKPVELALTMNLLLKKKLPIGNKFINEFIDTTINDDGSFDYKAKNLDVLKNAIRGYVSYYRGAPPHVFPQTIMHIVKCKMSDKQLKVYKKALKEEIGDDVDYIAEGISNNFFIGTRMISNMVFPNNKINEEGYNSLKDSNLLKPELEILSPKFNAILRKIKRTKGTVFVYSNFKEFGGIKVFARMLEVHGFNNYEYHGSGPKRFAIWSGDQEPHIKEEIKAVFNNKNNTNGSKIKIMLGSPSVKEGVTFLRIQGVHIIEPYWNMSRLEQIIGRASRFCSHKDVDEDRRVVNVYIYLSVHSSIPVSIDQHILQMAINKRKINNEFEMVLKESAIDCELFKNANVYSKKENYECVQ